MRYGILVLLLLLSLPLIAFNVSAQQVVSQDTVVLIKNTEMAGFVLGDKSQFVKIFKPYHSYIVIWRKPDIPTARQQSEIQGYS